MMDETIGIIVLFKVCYMAEKSFPDGQMISNGTYCGLELKAMA